MKRRSKRTRTTAKVDESQFARLKNQLEKFGRRQVVLVSNSMSPILPTGSLAEIAPCRINELSRFEMIVFIDEKKLICHMVWNTNEFNSPGGERQIVTRGLLGGGFDLPVAESRILGKVISHRIAPWKLPFILFVNRIRWRLSWWSRRLSQA